jgi:hypothetical protein
MYHAQDGILNYPTSNNRDEVYYFAGWSFGFETKYQTLTPTTYPDVKDVDDLDYDAYVYKYDFNERDSNKKCLYEEEQSKSDIRRRITLTGSSSIDSSASSTTGGLLKPLSLWKNNDDVPKEHKQHYYIPYVSRYSGGFALIDTMKIPRPCAFKSFNLTHVEYYRGQNTMNYDIGDENDVAYVLTQMTGDSKIIKQNGDPADSFA